MKTDDPLLQRYREANDIDTARPSPDLRETVLACARAAAQSARAPGRERPAANDAAWRWRALGGLAVLGLATLVVLEFDRGSRQEREVALGETTAPRHDSKASDARPAQTPPKAPASPADPSIPPTSSVPTSPRTPGPAPAPVPAPTAPATAASPAPALSSDADAAPGAASAPRNAESAREDAPAAKTARRAAAPALRASPAELTLTSS